jgi:hypothetical protein
MDYWVMGDMMEIKDEDKRKWFVNIYKVDAVVKLEIEAEDANEARKEALHQLTVGDGVYPDIHEADFMDSSLEFLIVSPFSGDIIGVNPGLNKIDTILKNSSKG